MDAAGSAWSEPVNAEAEIRQRVADRGAITFAEFMRLALYWPEGGYYRGLGIPIGGPSGDFYTSPLVHPAFGALLSIQLFQMWRFMDRPSSFSVLEMGAGNGRLCRDVVEFSRNLPEGFPQALGYICLDVDAQPGVEMGSTAAEGRPSVVRVAAHGPDWETLAPPPGIPVARFRGCVLSNELLDAIPVHQVTMQRGKLLEAYVALDQDELVIVHDNPSTPKLAERLDGLGVTLAEGQTAEICLGLAHWAEMVSDVLEDGFVLTVDYGREAGDLYSNEDRPRGTLTTFYRHIQTDAPLLRIGGQDITAQVDFTSVINEGRKVGLQPVGYSTQRGFLLNLGLQGWQRGLTRQGLPQRQSDANRAGMVDLVRPGGLGDFKVLIQGKGVGSPALWGFRAGGQPLGLERLMDSIPTPLMTPDHLDLNQGRDPGAGFEVEGYWPPLVVTDGDEEMRI
jgi:SAM-dependent MidA family methyltransferase